MWGNEFFSKVYDKLTSAYNSGENIVNSVCDSMVKKFQWIWEALQGDFNQDRTVGQIAADAVLGVIPIIDQVLDVRDLIANCMNINKAKENEDTSPHWIALGLTLVGFIPSLGSIAKGILKIILLMARKVGGNVAKALKPALVPIKIFLTDSKLKKIFPNIDYSKMLLEAAKKLESVKSMVNVRKLTQMFSETLDNLKGIINKVKYIAPKSVVQWLDNALITVTKIQKQADKMLEPALKPIQDLIDKITAFLRKEADSETKLVSNTKTVVTPPSAVANIDPRILTRSQKGIYGEIVSDEFMKNKKHIQLLPKGRYARTMDDVPKGRGMDGFYQNANSPPKYIVTETKYRTMVGNETRYIDSDGSVNVNLLGNSSYGKQMSHQWISAHTQSEFGNDLALLHDIINEKNYLSIIMVVNEKGEIVAANKVLSNGTIGPKINIDTMREIP